MYRYLEQLGTLLVLQIKPEEWGGEWIGTWSEWIFLIIPNSLSLPWLPRKWNSWCFAYKCIFLTLKQFFAPGGKRWVGDQKQLYLELMEDLEACFRVSSRVRGNKIMLLPCLVGTRKHKRWIHFSTWTFNPDYKVGWTEVGVSRQAGSRWGWVRLLKPTFCSHTKPSQSLPLIARSTFLYLHFILSDSKSLYKMWTQPLQCSIEGTELKHPSLYKRGKRFVPKPPSAIKSSLV